MKRYKDYSAKVIPVVKPQLDENGQPKNDTEGKPLSPKIEYVKKSLVTEKRTKAGIPQGEFYQVELIERGTGRFNCDPKGYTLNLFKNASPEWFDMIQDALSNKENFTELQTASKAALLNDTIPGLVVSVPTKDEEGNLIPYHPTVMDKETGIETPLESNQRDRTTGDFVPTPVVMNAVTFFMTKAHCHENEEAFIEARDMLAAPEIAKALEFKAEVPKVNKAA